MTLACSLTVLLAVMVHCATACTDTVYIGTLDGIVAISKDGGDTWSTVLNNGGRQFFSVSANGDNVYAATTYGLAVSHNGGASWAIKTIQTSSSCDPSVRSIFVDDEKYVYALVGVIEECGRVAISSNNGDSWSTNFPLPNALLAHNPYDIYVDGPRIYVATAGGLGFTDDLGTSWTFKNQSSGLGSDYVLSALGKGQMIYAGLEMDGGLVSASWDGGHTWKTVNTTPMGLNNWVESMYLKDDTLYVGTLGGGLSWSNDYTNWTTRTTVDSLASNDINAITGSGNNLYLATNSGVSISHDKGQTWITKTTKNGLPSNWITTVFVQCV